jgi:hypothetical protein
MIGFFAARRSWPRTLTMPRILRDWGFTGNVLENVQLKSELKVVARKVGVCQEDPLKDE